MADTELALPEAEAVTPAAETFARDMYHGRCYCGEIEFEFPKATAGQVVHCHCSSCRQWTGGAFLTGLVTKILPTYTKGEPSKFQKKGVFATKCFCKTCGTQIGNMYPPTSGYGMSVLLGIVQENAEFTTAEVQCHCQMQGKAPWIDVSADQVAQIDGFPAPPKSK